jgi:general secretion pathway protein C|nr:type II secretion system protein N [uncultured Undibacterium sp.]
MKRLPMLATVASFALLCAVLSYWGLQIFKPKIRPIAAPVMTASFEPAVGQWGSLFGQSAIAEAAPSNYQLKGVIVAAHAKDSAAIIAVDGKPTMTIGVGKALLNGVTLSEVHRDHIMVSEAGISRRIDLPPVPTHAGIQSIAPANPQTPVPPPSVQVPPPLPPPTQRP